MSRHSMSNYIASLDAQRCRGTHLRPALPEPVPEWGQLAFMSDLEIQTGDPK